MPMNRAAAPARRDVAAPAPVVHVVAAGEVGGAERLLAHLADPATAARPHLVALWTTDRALHDLFVDAGIPVLMPPGSNIGARKPWLPPLGDADVRWLAALLTSVSARAAHLHTFASHVLGTRAGLRAGVPVVRTEHSLRVYDNWLCRPLSAWSLRRCARAVTVSAQLGDVVRRRFPRLGPRLTVIPNGVAMPPLLSALAPPAEPDHRLGPLRLALVARLEPRKGIDRALQALCRVPGPLLDIVGDGPLRAPLQTQAAALGLGDRVRFWGYRRDPETVVAGADAVLCSSRTEGLPLSLLEAMALGRPVIAVPVGGVPELVRDGDNGWLAAADDTDQLVTTLRAAVAAGRAESRRRGQRARATVEDRFSLARMRQAYEALYRSLPMTRPAPTSDLTAMDDDNGQAA